MEDKAIDFRKNDGRVIIENEQVKSASSRLKKMGERVDLICESLAKDTKDFSPEKVFEDLHTYVQDEERLLYTNISNYIFLKGEAVFGKMETNLDKLIEYVYSEEFDQKYTWKTSKAEGKKTYDRTKRVVVKIWDHVNLARKQYNAFKNTDEEYEKIVDKKLSIVENKLAKDLTAQLISLIGIFTALSFLLFGGISSLDNIFSGLTDMPIIKLMIIGSIWCLAMMNMIFVFMFFIAKLTNLSISASSNINDNLIKKYPLIFWSNLVMVTFLVFSLWCYFVDHYNAGTFITNFASCKIVAPLGYILILFFFIMGVHWLTQHEKKKKEESD